MPVATLSTYEDLWVHPQVVAALGDGFTYVDIEAYDPTVAYAECSHVLAGDAPFGGYVWTNVAYVEVGGPGPLTPNQVVWQRDDLLLAQRLHLYSATSQATWMLDALSQFRLHGQEFWQEDYAVHSCTIRLRRSPVESIHSVTRVKRCNVVTDDVIDWCHDSQQTVSVCCNGVSFYGFSCGCSDNVVRVIYTIGSNLPPGTEGLTAWLANEYGKAAAGKACALPDRLSTITRQGVSWTVVDPQDYLTNKMTGMGKVDSWLAAVRLTMGGTLIDPLQSRRLFSTRLDALPVVEAT
jgi:hypothetical protein